MRKTASEILYDLEVRIARLERLSSTEIEKAFDEAVKGMKFTNPETKNKVLFNSLPNKEQARVRKKFVRKKQEEGKSSDPRKSKVMDALSEIKGTKLKNLSVDSDDWNEELMGLEESAVEKVVGSFGLSKTQNIDFSSLSDEDLKHLSSAMDAVKGALLSNYTEARKNSLSTLPLKKEGLKEAQSATRKLESEREALELELRESKKGATLKDKKLLLDRIEKSDTALEKAMQAESDALTEVSALEELKNVKQIAFPHSMGVALEVKREVSKRAEKSRSNAQYEDPSLKAFGEQMKKEEEEKKALIKKYQAKLKDLESSFQKAKNRDEVFDISNEFARVKGVISQSSDLHSEFWSDLSSIQGMRSEAFERTSLVNKFKNFFGFGKKASLEAISLELEENYQRIVVLEQRLKRGREA